MKNQKGFSLIELLVVVAVLGILVAISIPEFNRYQMKSKRVEGISLIRSLEISQTSYYLVEETYASLFTQLSSSGHLLESQTKFYNPGNFYSNNYDKGYVAIVSANLDADPNLDRLTLKVRDPGANPVWDTLPDTIHVYIDDILL